MSPITFVAYCALVFWSAAAIDYAAAKYDGAMSDARRGIPRADIHAARWSVAMYAVSCMGFIAVVNVSLWLMVPEGMGFYLGTRLALRKPRQVVT